MAPGGRCAATGPRRTVAVWLAALAALLALPLPVAAQTSTEVLLTVTPALVAESAGATELTVTGTLDGAARSVATEVALSVRGGTATEEYDYMAGTATLTIAANQTGGTATLTLTPLDEHLHEPAETVMVVGTVDGGGLSVQGAQVTITDNDPAPMVHPMLEECETTDVWCAEMTVGRVLLDAAGEVRADETNAGYDATMARGALRPDSFELGGVSYTVDRLYRAATSTEMTILLFVKTSPRLPDVDRAALVLRVGGQAYPLSQSDYEDEEADPNAIGWTEDRQRTLASGVVRPWLYGQRVTARLTGLTPPDAPGSLAARFGDGEVRLSWTRPPDGGAPITGYQYRQMGASDTTWNPDWTGIPDSADTTSYTVDSLTNGTAYTFEVRARNRAGAGPPSNPATDTPNAPQVPAPPGGLHAVVGSGQLTLAWTAPAYRGAAVTLYDYRHKISADTTWNPDWTDIPDSGADTTSYTVGSLVDGTTYSLEVRAVSSAGNGMAAATSGTPSADPVPVTVSFGAVSGPALEGPMPDDAEPRVQPTEVVVSLSAPPGRQVVIPVTAAGAAGATPRDWGLATDAGLTFGAVAADLTFGAAATSQTIVVLAFGDEVWDPGERVRLGFGALPDGVSAGDPRTATVSLIETNAVPYQIVITAPERVVEGEPVPLTLTATSRGSERPRYSFEIIFETRRSTPTGGHNVIDRDSLGARRSFDGSGFVRHGDRWVATQVYDDAVTTIDDDRAEGDETFRILPELKLGAGRQIVEFARGPQFLTVTVEEDDHAPAVTTASPIPALSGGTTVGTLAATDADGDPLTWSLAGGADASHFDLTSAGVLSFLSAKDIDLPDDADRDGVYQITVTVTDDHNPVTADLAVQLVRVLPDATPVAPGAPTGFTARADGAYEIVLSWTAPADDGGAPVTGYRIEVFAAGSWTEVEADTGTPATGYVHAGRTPATAYGYRVSAINTAGPGATSAEAMATTGQDLVCARTEAVRDAIVAAVAEVSACGKVTAAHLADITVLDVSFTSAPATLAAGDFAGLTALASLFLDAGTQRLTSLPAELFDGLSGLTTLDLSGNDFETLPAGLFADVSALTTLDLSGDDFETLPAAVFADVSALTTLDLSGNDFETLPAGVFTGLSALAALDLSGNPGAPLALTVSLQAAGDGRIKAVAPAGAPFRLELPVSAVNGTFGAGSDATAVLAIAAGAVESAPLRVARAAGTTAPVTANLGRPLPLPPLDHDGYDLAAAADGLPLEVLGSGVATAPGLVVDAPAPLTVDEGAGASYTVALATAPTGDVTVTVSGHAATDLMLDVASLTFTTVSWGTARTVTVTAGQDMDLADDAVTLTHTASGGGYGAVATESVAVLVADDDQAAWTVTVAPAMIAEADRGAAAVTVDTGGFIFAQAQAIRLDFAGSEAAVQRDFMVADSGGAELAAPYRLTLAAGATTATATLTAVDDGVAESEEKIRITARHAGSAVGTVGTVTIADDTRPAAPTGLTATADGAYEIDLSWMAPAQTGGTAIRGYLVEVSDDAGLNWSVVTADTESADTTYEHGGLTAQTTYRYRVSAINHSDTGEPSDYAEATTAEDLVCGRTGAVRDAIVAAVFGARADAGDSCGKASAGQLGALPRLDLGGSSISALPASDLDGLTGLTELDLSGNTLTELPWAAIATLTGLTELDLGSNQLTSVPASAFASLTTLKKLDLGSNQLTTLPAGVFGGLTELTTLDLGNNAAALSLEVSLLTAGEGQFKAAVREGAPFAIELPLTVSGGTIDGGESTVTIPAGGVESDALGVTRTTADAVSVDIGTPLPAPPSGHTGYALARSADGLPLEVLAAVPAVASVMVSSDPGADATYAIGDAVAATVTFSEAVDVDTMDGTPQLEIDVGGTPQPLSYGAGSGTAALTFTGYTVAENDEGPDGIAVAANKLSLNSGTITKAGDSTIAAILTHPEVPADAAHLVDGVRPTLSTEAASTDGASIELTFSEPLLAATAPASAFTVTVDAAVRGVDTVAAADTAVTLTLGAAVTAGQTVTVAYADPSGDDDANAVQDAAGNDAPTFAAQEVTNNSPSTMVTLSVTPETVAEDAGTTELTVTGTLNGAVRTEATEVTLAVAAGTATATDDYTTGAAPTLTIDAGDRSGTAEITFTPVDDADGEGKETVSITGMVTVETLTVSGTELTITDDDAIPVDVTLALTSDPDSSGADDDTYAIGNVVEATATFSGTITVTGGPPQLELDIGSSPRLADCAVATDTTMLLCSYTIAEGDEDTDGIAIEANKIALNGATITLAGDSVTPTHNAKDDDSVHLVEGVRPTLINAETSADGTKVLLTYDESLSATTAATTTFTVNVSTANEAATPSITAAAADGLTVTLTLGTAVKAGQVVTVDYADPGTGNDTAAVQDAVGNDAASLSGEAVTNNVPEDATVSALSSTTLTEGGDNVTVTVTIAAGATFATDRSVALAWGGTALAANSGLIREPSGLSRVLIAAGESSGTATLVGVQRAAYTASRTEALTATFDGTEIGNENLTYMDSGSAPAATIAATPAMLPEGGDITVEVTLSRPVDTDVSVALTMSDVENVVSGTLPAAGIAIGANETTGTVTLSTSADMMTGNDAAATFTLTANASAPYTLGTPKTVTVTVLDDTSASDGITLSVSPAEVDEDGGATTLTVTATVNRAPATTATTVGLSVAAGTATETTDYAATTATLTIAANARTGTATLTLTPVDDANAEPDETVTVQGTATGFTLSGAEVTILDDDEPAITLSFIDTWGSQTDNFVPIGEDVGSVSVQLRATTGSNTAPTRDIAVTVQAVEEEGQQSVETGDYKPFRHTYTFAATDFVLTSGEYTLTRSTDLEIIDDITVEKNESLDIAVDTSTIPRHVTPPRELIVEMVDNDTATISYAAQSHEVEEGEQVVLTITVSAAVEFPFTVIASSAELPYTGSVITPEHEAAYNTQLATVAAFATADDDYVHAINVVELPPFKTRQITVTTVEDTIDDDDEAFLMLLVDNGLDSKLTLDRTYSFITIIDDDSPSTKVTLSVTPDTVAEDAGATELTVTGTLDVSARTEATEVALAVSDGTAVAADYGATTATLTIDAAQISGMATLTLTPMDDHVAELNETVSVDGTVTVGSLTVTPTTVTITDNDEPQWVLTALPAMIAEDGGTAEVQVASGGVTFPAPQEISLTFAGTAAKDTDYSVGAETLTLAIGATEVTTTITATDDIADGEKTIEITASLGGTQIGTTATVTITDDDEPQWVLTALPVTITENGGTTEVQVASGGVTFLAPQEISLTFAGSAAKDSDYSVGAETLTLAIGATEVTTTITATDDNVVDGEKTIEITASLDSAQIGTPATVTITDDESPSTMVTLSVTPVTVVEDAGATELTVTGTLDAAVRTVATAVTLSAGADGDTATATTDYTAGTATLTIAAGDTGGMATLTLTPVDDAVDEGEETLTVGGTVSDGALTVTGATVTIAEVPLVEIAALSSPVTEGEAAAFTLTRLGAATAALTVAVQVTAEGEVLASPSDFASPVSVAFVATEATATLAVATDDDTTKEDLDPGPARVAGRVTAAVQTGTGYAPGRNGTDRAVVDVLDDEPRPVLQLFHLGEVNLFTYDAANTGTPFDMFLWFPTVTQPVFLNANFLDVIQVSHGTASNPYCILAAGGVCGTDSTKNDVHYFTVTADASQYAATEGELTVSIPADIIEGGNESATRTFTVDLVPLTVSLTGPSRQPVNGNFDVTIQFSRDVERSSGSQEVYPAWEFYRDDIKVDRGRTNSMIPPVRGRRSPSISPRRRRSKAT